MKIESLSTDLGLILPLRNNQQTMEMVTLDIHSAQIMIT